MPKGTAHLHNGYNRIDRSQKRGVDNPGAYPASAKTSSHSILINRLLTIFFTMSFSGIFAQKVDHDYLKSRDDLFNPVCGWRDSLTAAEVAAQMLAADTNKIKRNIDFYFADLAMVESELYAYTMDTTILRSSANHYLSAVYHNPDSDAGLWGAAFNLQRLGDCEKSSYYLSLYEQRVEKKYRISQGQIDLLKSKCSPKP